MPYLGAKLRQDMLFRNLFNAFFLLLFSLPLIIVILMLDREPATDTDKELSRRDDIEAVQDFLVANDPRSLFDGEVQNIVLPEPVADSLLRYLASEARGFGEVYTETTFIADEAVIDLSVPVNGWILGDYMNIRVSMDEGALPVRISTISLGSIELPYWLAEESLDMVLRLVDDQPEARTMLTLLSGIHQVSFTPGMAHLQLQLDPVQVTEVRNSARDMMIPSEQQSRVVDYYQCLVNAETAVPDSNSGISLNTLFNELFAVAYDNVLAGKDAASENRAAFLAMAVYLTDLTLEQVSNTELEPELKNHTRSTSVYLNGREDLAVHVVISAALASSSGRNISRILTVYKEVSDSKTGTGFSFDDMIANTVGTTLGEIATSTQSTAHRLQNTLKDVASETDYMPTNTTGTTLTEEEFNAVYGSRNSNTYRARMTEIEQSIAALPLFQEFSRDIEVNPEP